MVLKPEQQVIYNGEIRRICKVYKNYITLYKIDSNEEEEFTISLNDKNLIV